MEKPSRHLRVVALLAMLSGSTVHAQTLSSWSNVESLRPGTTVTCILKDRSQVQGRLTTAGPDGISITPSQAKPVSVERERVQGLYALKRPLSRKAVWIGLGAGALAGVAIGASGTADSAGGYVALAALGTGIFGAIGAGIGHLLRGRPEEVVIYRAR